MKYEQRADGRLGLRTFAEPVDPTLSFLAFPYAGGQSLAFRGLAQSLPERWGFRAIDPPGHGWVRGELLTDFERAVEFYLEELEDLFTPTTIFVGCSLGGAVAFRLAKRLMEEDRPPAGIIVIATRPPHRNVDHPPLSSLTNDDLLHSLVDLGGLPAEWAEDPRIVEPFLPALRADLEIFESISLAPIESYLPILLIGGRKDTLCRPEEIQEWDRYAANIHLEMIDGGHFLAQQQASIVGTVVRRHVEDRMERRH